MAYPNYTVVESQNVALGQAGSAHLDAGQSVSNLNGSVVAITMAEDTTFTTLTQTNAKFMGTGTSTFGDSIGSGDTFPAGMTIYGKWSAVTVNSGSCVCYLG